MACQRQQRICVRRSTTRTGRERREPRVWRRHHAEGALWCRVVYPGNVPTTAKPVRRSVNLPARVARRVRALAQTTKTSTSRVIADLIESGLDAREQEKKRFFECADRLSRSRDPEEQARLKEELARMTFGA